MIVRTLIHGGVAVIIFAILGLTGCSGDSTAVISPLNEESSDFLSTGIDLPESGFDMDDYIAEGYYYPDEYVDQNVDEGDNPEDRFYNDDPSDKPIDNGLGDN